MDACIASFAMLCLKSLSSLIFTLLREAWKKTSPGVPAGPGLFCLLMSPQCRLFLLNHGTTADLFFFYHDTAELDSQFPDKEIGISPKN